MALPLQPKPSSPHSLVSQCVPLLLGRRLLLSLPPMQTKSLSNRRRKAAWGADLGCRCIYHKGVPIFSRVVETETSTPWFHSWPFRIDALDRKDPPSTPRAATAATTIESVISPAELTLSWVVIDPIGKRAVNISSQKPVAVDRHWYTGEKLVRFAMVLNDWCSLGAVVTCEEETGQVREVSMTVEDMDGTCLNGKDSLGVLRGLMEGGRRGRRREEEAAAAKERYRDYLRRKRERKDKKARIEGRLDMLCAAIGASAFLALCLLFVFK